MSEILTLPAYDGLWKLELERTHFILPNTRDDPKKRCLINYGIGEEEKIILLPHGIVTALVKASRDPECRHCHAPLEVITHKLSEESTEMWVEDNQQLCGHHCSMEGPHVSIGNSVFDQHVPEWMDIEIAVKAAYLSVEFYDWWMKLKESSDDI